MIDVITNKFSKRPFPLNYAKLIVLVDLKVTAIPDQVWCPNYKCKWSYGTAATSPCAARRSRCSCCCRRLITPIVISVLVGISGPPRWSWSGMKPHTGYEHIYYLVPDTYMYPGIRYIVVCYIPRAGMLHGVERIYTRGVPPDIHP